MINPATYSPPNPFCSTAKRLGRYLLFSEKLQRLAALPLKSQLRLRRFQDSCWKLLFYGMAELGGLALFWGEAWVWAPSDLFRGVPRQSIR